LILFFNFIYLAYDKSDIMNLIRHVLQTICAVNGQNVDMYLDEFTKARLMKCFDKCTKTFVTDEADTSFVDAGLFNGFTKPSEEENCRCTFSFL
jgi:hypothetical protein